MTGWESVPFGAAAADVSAGNPKVLSSAYQPSGDFPVIDQGAAEIAGYVNDPGLLYRGELPVVIFGDHTRNLKYVDSRFCVGADGVKILRPREGFDAKYLYHALRDLRIPGAGYSRHFKYLKESRIPKPGLDEQRRIAELLDRADSLRATRRAALAESGKLEQALFREMFGDPVLDRRDWHLASCEAVCGRVTVGIVFQPASHYRPSGTVALRSLNIRPGEIDLNDVVFFSEEENSTILSKTRVRAGDVVLVRTGRPGTAAVIPDELDGVNAVDILITTPDRTVVDPRYLCSYFNSPAAKRHISGHRRGQIQQHLNVGSLKQMPVPLPPLELQKQYAERLGEISELRNRQRAGEAQLEALFDALQHRAFRNEL